MISSKCRNVKDYVMIKSHIEDKPAAYMELKVFNEHTIDFIKARDVLRDVKIAYYNLLGEDYNPDDDYELVRMGHEDYAASSRFERVSKWCVKLALEKLEKDIKLCCGTVKSKWNASIKQYIYDNELSFELYYDDIENDDITDYIRQVFKEFCLDENFSISSTLKRIKYKTGVPDEQYLKDRLGNIPEPGDAVIVLGPGKSFISDIFVGFNKKRWKTLNGCGYGFVVAKHPANSNGGEPLKLPEAWK